MMSKSCGAAFTDRESRDSSRERRKQL